MDTKYGLARQVLNLLPKMIEQGRDTLPILHYTCELLKVLDGDSRDPKPDEVQEVLKLVAQASVEAAPIVSTAKSWLRRLWPF